MPDDPLMFNLRPRILELALQLGMPDFHWASEFVEAGGLMSYGERLSSSYRSAASYMTRIKNGANPGELPVLQPTVFELAVNTKRARAFGIALPQELLLRADTVIQ
jgi:ABC-type uncharacterized transport system substrate-binding protein